MFLLGECINLRGSVIVVNPSFSAKSVDIYHFVDSKGMLLVEGNPVEAFASSKSFSRSRVFNESKSVSCQYVPIEALASSKSYLFDLPSSPIGM
jgi:hypothetical protein